MKIISECDFVGNFEFLSDDRVAITMVVQIDMLRALCARGVERSIEIRHHEAVHLLCLIFSNPDTPECEKAVVKNLLEDVLKNDQASAQEKDFVQFVLSGQVLASQGEN